MAFTVLVSEKVKIRKWGIIWQSVRKRKKISEKRDISLVKRAMDKKRDLVLSEALFGRPGRGYQGSKTR